MCCYFCFRQLTFQVIPCRENEFHRTLMYPVLSFLFVDVTLLVPEKLPLTLLGE